MEQAKRLLLRRFFPSLCSLRNLLMLTKLQKVSRLSILKE